MLNNDRRKEAMGGACFVFKGSVYFFDRNVEGGFEGGLKEMKEWQI